MGGFSLRKLAGLRETGSDGTLDAFRSFERLVRELQPRIDQARARLDSQTNPFIGDIAGLSGRFGEIAGQLGGISGIGTDFSTDFDAAARATTADARRGAVQTARTSAARGGLAFGGGAGAIAASAGRNAAVQGGAALAQGRLQARLAESDAEKFNRQLELQKVQGLGNLARSQGEALGSAASFFDRGLDRSANLDTGVLSGFLGGGFNLAGQGLAGDTARADRRLNAIPLRGLFG